MVEIKRKKRFVFNPDEETKEMLITTFAIRTEIFEKIFKTVKSSSRDTAPQHFLLTGQRGMGKTTLLLRLKYAMEDDKELNEYLLPVRFSEEQYQIGCLPDLWEETAVYLESMSTQFIGLKDDMLTHEKEKDYERICFDLLSQKLKKNKKRVVLLIDNIGDLFLKLTTLETHRFREILMTSPHILVIGASSQMLEHTYSYDKPFFEFFYQLKLEPIKNQEATQLMKALAGNYDVYNRIEKIIEDHPERIEVLRRITGGVPRTLVLLFEIFVDSDNGNTFEDLEELADRVSPLYKERMDSLKPQQQKIMDALARAWEPITANEILAQSKLYREELASNQISSQLKQLEENQLVESILLGKRKKAYRIRERFFNIWYLMRHGRKNTKEQVLWLVRFLESWCTHTELNEIVAKQIECLSNNGYSAKAAYYKALAFHSIKEVPTGLKKQLLKETENHLFKIQKKDWAETIHKLADELDENIFSKEVEEALEKGKFQEVEKLLVEGAKRGESNAYYNLGVFYTLHQKDFGKAEQFYLKAIEKEDADALFNLALLYENEFKAFDKAEQFYLKANEKGNVKAANNLALLYEIEFKDYNKAEQFYLIAIEMGDVKAFNNLASLYESEFKDSVKAEQFYLKAIEKGNTDALLNLALLYHTEFKDFVKAEQFYLKDIEKGNTDALFNLALLYHAEFKDFVKAEQFYLKAIEKGNTDALFNLAFLCAAEFKDFVKAEKFYLKAVEKGSTDALFNLALLYETEFKDFVKAEEFYLKATEKGDTDALFNLALLYETEFKDFVKAEQFYLKAIEKGDTDALFDLALLYETEFKDFVKAEQFYLKAIEKGDTDALINMALLYQTEFRDFVKAEQFYLKAIEKGNTDAFFAVALLYTLELKDFRKAEQFYLKAIDIGNVKALYNLALLYETELNDSGKAEQYYLKAIEKGDVKSKHNYSLLMLEKNKINDSINQAISLLNNEVYLTDNNQMAIELVLKFIIHGQNHFLLKIFQQAASLLLKYLQPVYYVLAWFMKDDLPGEYEKAGAEIKETVDEMIKAVENAKATMLKPKV